MIVAAEMTYTVTIREVATGNSVDYHQAVGWQDHTLWMWEEGNYSCDCNREAKFCHAAGREYSDEELACGRARFVVTKIVLENGAVMFEGEI